MRRIYWLMAIAGFVGTLAFIFGPYLFSANPDFGLATTSSGLAFILSYYVLSLVFFAMIVLVLSGLRRKEDAHTVLKEFLLSLLGFSLGSWFASILFLLMIGLAWGTSQSPIF